MDQKDRSRLASKQILWVCLSLLLVTTQPSHSAPRILLHQTVDITALDSAYLRQIFAMQVRQWPDNQAIHVYTLASSSDLHQKFVIDHLKIQPHQLDRIWNRMLFTGTGKPPTVVASEEEMVKAVQATPGAIGYVSEGYAIEEVEVPKEAQQ